MPALTPAQWVLVALALLMLATGGLIAYRQWRRRDARRARLRQVTSIAYDVLQNVLLPDGNEGQLHLDFVLLTATGLLVVDLRDVGGIIFGSEAMDEWTVMDGHRRNTFQNPLGPLYDRMAVVRQLAGKDIPVDGRVVFTARGSFPKGRPPRVTHLDRLAGEFGEADRSLDPSPVAGWLDEWETLRKASMPSPLQQHY